MYHHQAAAAARAFRILSFLNSELSEYSTPTVYVYHGYTHTHTHTPVLPIDHSSSGRNAEIKAPPAIDASATMCATCEGGASLSLLDVSDGMRDVDDLDMRMTALCFDT